jgi:hypothetical protein
VADQAMGESPQEQGALARLGVLAHHWVLGFEDLGYECAEMGQPLLSDLVPQLQEVDPAVVVAVGVDRPQPVGQGAQVVREVGVGGDRVRPQGVAAHFGQDQGAQDGEGGRLIHEGDVGVPVVGRTPGQRVEVEDQLFPIDHGQGRVALRQRPQAAGEVDLLGRAQVLPAHEGNSMGQHGGPQLLNLVIFRGAQVDARQLGADAPGEPASGNGRPASVQGHGSSRIGGEGILE